MKILSAIIRLTNVIATLLDILPDFIAAINVLKKCSNCRITVTIWQFPPILLIRWTNMQKKLYVDDFSAFGEAYFAHIVRLQSPIVVQKEGFE